MRWNLQSNVSDVLSLGPRTAGQLATAGIRTVAELVAASPLVVSQRLNESTMTPETLAEWQREALLIVEIPQLSANAARSLAAAGFACAEKIGHCSPTELLAALETAVKDNPTHWLAQTALPTIAEVSAWIRFAGKTQNSYAA